MDDYTPEEMEEAARKAKREYMRKWRAEHPDKVKAAQDRFWSRKVGRAIGKYALEWHDPNDALPPLSVFLPMDDDDDDDDKCEMLRSDEKILFITLVRGKLDIECGWYEDLVPYVPTGKDYRLFRRFESSDCFRFSDVKAWAYCSDILSAFERGSK